MEEKNEKSNVPAQKEHEFLTMMKKSIVDVVEAKVDGFLKNGQLILPKKYAPENALKSAWLILQSTTTKEDKPVLHECSRDSIANALLDMIVQGLNPMKKQCYFIAYKNRLTCQRSYFGDMAVAEMVQPKIADFSWGVIYVDDTFKYGIKNGKKTVIEHVQELKNIQKDRIMGAYAMALDENGDPYRTEIMSFEQIKQSWKQSPLNPFDGQGNIKPDSTHGKFPADMALRTVIRKNCKYIVNASTDNALLLEAMKRAEELADAAAVEEEIEELENQGPVLEIAPSEQPEPTNGAAPETKTQVVPEPEAKPEPAPREEKRVAEQKRGPSF